MVLTFLHCNTLNIYAYCLNAVRPGTAICVPESGKTEECLGSFQQTSVFPQTVQTPCKCVPNRVKGVLGKILRKKYNIAPSSRAPPRSRTS